jgi:hypothetical protein
MALPQWYVCVVNNIGVGEEQPGGVEVFLRLSDTANPPAFQNQLFEVNSNIANQVLAIALAAVNAGLQVRALLEEEAPPVAGHPQPGTCSMIEIVTAS